jgi:hypothetical protein
MMKWKRRESGLGIFLSTVRAFSALSKGNRKTFEDYPSPRDNVHFELHYFTSFIRKRRNTDSQEDRRKANSRNVISDGLQGVVTRNTIASPT